MSQSCPVRRHLGMKIVITGATGVIGWRSVRRLVNEGHHVTGITHSARGRELLEALGARAEDGNVFEPATLHASFVGADAVINLLTRVPPAHRMGEPEAWRENDRLRREAAAVIASAARQAGVERLVQESVALLYADGGDRWLDEDAPLEPAPSTASALTAERTAKILFAGDIVILRFGIFMGPDSSLTLAELEQARAGRAVRIGQAATRVPTVWLDDAAAAVAAALRVAPGTYNVVDDDPPTRAEIEAALGTHVRDVVPELDPLSRSLRVSNRRLRATGWAPRVRAGVDGWDLIAHERRVA
jgi:nucleoside-diphosphate-sugar epimerase